VIIARHWLLRLVGLYRILRLYGLLGLFRLLNGFLRLRFSYTTSGRGCDLQGVLTRAAHERTDLNTVFPLSENLMLDATVGLLTTVIIGRQLGSLDRV
tara:strand:+ start:2070 stop:2363 length:294 start_codon:yes stop_codon:yes gene_type:complete